MTQYAHFDSTLPPPQPVLGWYDTDVLNYPALPPAQDLLALSPDEWADRLSGHWAVEAGGLVPYTPPAPVLTLAQQATALLYSGLSVTSNGDSSLNATYAADPTTQIQINAEVTSILLSGTFTDGNSTIEWPDITSTPDQLSMHLFSVDQYKTFASAIAAFVTGCARCVSGQATSLPPTSTTIP